MLQIRYVKLQVFETCNHLIANKTESLYLDIVLSF